MDFESTRPISYRISGLLRKAFPHKTFHQHDLMANSRFAHYV